jgi:hypothetical protein
VHSNATRVTGAWRAGPGRVVISPAGARMKQQATPAVVWRSLCPRGFLHLAGQAVSPEGLQARAWVGASDAAGNPQTQAHPCPAYAKASGSGPCFAH